MTMLKGSKIKAKIAELGELKRLPDCGSPISWIFLFIAAVPLFYLTLKPSIGELLLLLFVDTVAFQINTFADTKLFAKIYPEFASIFPVTDMAKYEKFNESERLNFLQLCFQYSKKRAIYCYFESFLKVVPAISVVVFVWDHPTRTNFSQFLMILSVCMVIWTYFCSVVFIDSHRFLSKLIAQLHQKQDWSQTFMAFKPQQSSSFKDFQKQELVVLMFMGIFTFILQWDILSNLTSLSFGNLFQVVFVGMIGLALFSRIFILSRNFFSRSLFNIFENMERMDLKKSHFTLPLHTTPVLATFEQSFNILMQRLKDHEQELSYLVLKESDRSRYEALGEISALIAHDMSGPLHVVQFIAQELKENPQLSQNPEYVQRMNSGIARAMDLLNSLKARLKNKNSDKKNQTFSEAHQHVLKILEVQFYNQNFSRISFYIDPKIINLVPPMPTVDLIHVLENLYKNSVKNMIDFSVKDPTIRVTLESMDKGNTDLLISDNGTGLSKDRFDELTAFRFFQSASRQRSYEGLGLRLTRRLVELHGGQLDVISNSDSALQQSSGTVFKLTLPNCRLETVEKVTNPSSEKYKEPFVHALQ